MYAFSGVTYQKDTSIVIRYLESHNYIASVILHDQDKNKVPHVHFVFLSESDIEDLKLWSKSAKETFIDNVFLQRCKSYCDAIDYLTHEHCRNKYHYDETEVYHTDKAKMEHFYTTDIKYADDFLSDLVSYNFSYMGMASKYGRDFILHCEKYIEFRQKVLTEMEQRERERVRLAEERQALISRYERITALILQKFPHCKFDSSFTPEFCSKFTDIELDHALNLLRRTIRCETNIVDLYSLSILPNSLRERWERLIYNRQANGQDFEFYGLDYHDIIIPYERLLYKPFVGKKDNIWS